jgi:hypothetical protein
MLPLLPPIRVELETWGNEFGDFAFGPGDELLVSDRVLKLYEKARLTGLIDVCRVELAKVKSFSKLCQPTPPSYHCCRVSRSRAAVDDKGSELEREEPWTCKECRLSTILRAKRVLFEPDSWSGEDVFVARGLPGFVLVSEAFERLCRSNQISNCLLVPAQEFSFDFVPWEKRTGGG